MTTYICKCGKTFPKNTGASTTGYRMPDYGPEHECYGCPYVCEVLTWDPSTQQEAVQNHECRGSKQIRYGTTAGINLSDKCTADIHTLDFDFLRQVHEFANTLEGFEPDRYFFANRASCYGPDGRYRYTFYPRQNKKGIAAKAALRERFFYADGSRKDITPEQEEEIVLNQIRTAKEEAQSMNTYYAPCGQQFRRAAGGVPEISVEVTGKGADCFSCPHGLHEPETDEHAPRIMCVCDRKQVEPADTPITMEESMAQQPDDEQNDLGPDGMEELAEYQELTQPGGESANESPESENDGADSGDAANEKPDSDNESGDSANDTEQPPETCSWQNASGSEENEPDEPQENIQAGERVSLRDNAFELLISACDEKINRALRMAIDAQQGFTVTTKIVFEPSGTVFRVKYETGYQFDPIKVKDKGELHEEIQIALDDAGNPIIPYDREHQMTFDEITPAPAAPVATQVDGNTGLVEKVTVREETEKEDNPDEAEEQEEEKPLYPCNCHDCPFFAVGVGEDSGCCFDEESPDSGGYAGDVWEAVHMNDCKRQEVMEAYRQNDPDEGYDGADELGDPEVPENNEEDYAS